MQLPIRIAIVLLAGSLLVMVLPASGRETRTDLCTGPYQNKRVSDETLKVILQAHLSWLQNPRAPQAQKANLCGAILSKAKLAGAKLKRADLRLAKLNRADLTGADLTKAKMNRAFLVKAILKQATLDGADLSHSLMNKASLHKAS